jgi:hypothetical protein
MFGIAVLAVTGWWWPGIMVLVGLSAIFGAVSRNDKAENREVRSQESE